MNGVAALIAILGIIIIATRAPLIFAPGATRELWLKIFSTNTRIRIFGLFAGTLGIAMILVGRGSEDIASLLVMGLGYLLVLMTIFPIMIFTSIWKIIVQAVLEGMDDLILRGLGVISVGLGLVIVYLGISLL